MARRCCGTYIVVPFHWRTDITFQQRGVEHNNKMFLETIAPSPANPVVQVSVPSSTSASGFNTPLEIPITPGEPMDVTN